MPSVVITVKKKSMYMNIYISNWSPYINMNEFKSS